MIKKVCCTILCVCLLAVLIGCGSADEEVEETTTTAVETETEATTTKAEPEEITTEAETEATTAAETEATTTEITEFDYGVMVVQSDEYLEITLETITTDNIYFSITNVSDQTIQVSAEYIQLDGVEYTYEDTNYSTPMILIVSGDTLDYEFCDYSIENDVDFQTADVDCEEFSGCFAVWDDEGYLIEYAEASGQSLVGCAGVSVALDTSKADGNRYNLALYSDEYVDIELISISGENAYFVITNNSNQVLQVCCEYFELDDVEYTGEDTNYSTPLMVIAPGGSRLYRFCDYDTGNEIDFEIINPDFDVFSGAFEILDGEGYQIEYANITDVSVK